MLGPRLQSVLATRTQSWRCCRPAVHAIHRSSSSISDVFKLPPAFQTFSKTMDSEARMLRSVCSSTDTCCLLRVVINCTHPPGHRPMLGNLFPRNRLFKYICMKQTLGTFGLWGLQRGRHTGNKRNWRAQIAQSDPRRPNSDKIPTLMCPWNVTEQMCSGKRTTCMKFSWQATMSAKKPDVQKKILESDLILAVCQTICWRL